MIKPMAFLLTAALLLGGCAHPAEAPSTVDAPVGAISEEKTEKTEGNPAEAWQPMFSNVTVSVRRNAQVVSERAVTAPEELRMAEEIVFDYLAKSAAWEGIEVSELEECITLSFDWGQDDLRQNYYQYETEGKPVLQAGEAGWYSIMSQEAYEELLCLAGLSSEAGEQNPDGLG